MTKPYSLDLRERVTERVAAGDSVRAVATILSALGLDGAHGAGSAWHTPSWRDVAPGHPVEMLLQHLKAFK
jgi:transposase